MTRGGKHKAKATPERKCIVTGKLLNKEELIRFVLSPDGMVTPDLATDLPGRGLWVVARRDALEKAIEKNLFSRAAKAQATLPDDLLGLVDTLLARRIGDLIGLARKGGSALCGFDTVKNALLLEKVSILLQASDGSERQISKLRPPKGKARYFRVLTQEELGLSFGRDYVIHAALTGGGLVERIRAEAMRLAGIRHSDQKLISSARKVK